MLVLKNGDDKKTLQELRTHGYSEKEIATIQELIANSRRFTQELHMEKPLTIIEFKSTNDTVSDRLGVINQHFANLAKLPSQKLTDVLDVEKVTPENIAQVLKTIHAGNDEDFDTMYDKTTAAARKRFTPRQGETWINTRLPTIPQEALVQACNAINASLANIEHVRKETVRMELVSILDRYTPVPADIQPTALANRPLNFAQSLAWTTALAKPGTPYRSSPGEIMTITINGVSYSMAPESRIQSIPGIPGELR